LNQTVMKLTIYVVLIFFFKRCKFSGKYTTFLEICNVFYEVVFIGAPGMYTDTSTRHANQ